MDDPDFIEWAQSRGLEAGTASEDYNTWLRAHCANKRDYELLSGFCLKSTSYADDACYVGTIWMYDEGSIMGNPDGERCLPSRVLTFGGCGNGDHFAVDLATEGATVGFLDHERLWSPDKVDIRTVFINLGMSFGEFRRAIESGAEIYDYYSAKRFLKANQ